MVCHIPQGIENKLALLKFENMILEKCYRGLEYKVKRISQEVEQKDKELKQYEIRRNFSSSQPEKSKHCET